MGICNHFALFWCITRRITVTDFWCFCGKQTRTDHVRFFVLLHLFKCGHTRTAFCSSGDINDRIRFKFSIGDAFCFLPHKIKRLFSILFYQESHTKNRLKILSVILQKLFSGHCFLWLYKWILFVSNTEGTQINYPVHTNTNLPDLFPSNFGDHWQTSYVT